MRYAVAAPAKVNLTLHVLGRRADGYHDIASLLAAISLFDRLVVEVGGRVMRVTVPGRNELETDDNLVLRAARAFVGRTGLRGGVRVRIDKQIPVEGGLGGGSSDAAAVLRVLCRHHGLRTSDPRVQAAALDVGSDVPFFLRAAPALARGRGDRLEAAPALPDPLWLLVVKPSFGVPTASAYATLARGRSSGTIAPGAERPLPRSLRSAAAVARILHNDLQAPVAGSHPIEDVAGRLAAAGTLGVVMSGSGSCVIAIVRNESHARKCAALLMLRPGESVFVVRTLKLAPGVRDA